jgi:hypothetical protein
VYRTAQEPTQPPIQWAPGALSLGVKRPGREADHSPPTSAEVKECVELYLHSPIRLHGVTVKTQGQLHHLHLPVSYCLPIYVSFFQVVSFLQVFQPKYCTNLFPQCVLHVSNITYWLPAPAALFPLRAFIYICHFFPSRSFHPQDRGSMDL